MDLAMFTMRRSSSRQCSVNWKINISHR